MKYNHVGIGNLCVPSIGTRTLQQRRSVVKAKQRTRPHVLQQRVQSRSDGALKASDAPHSFCSSDTRQWSDKWLSGSRASGVFWDVSYLAGASQTLGMSPASVTAGFLSQRLSYRWTELFTRSFYSSPL